MEEKKRKIRVMSQLDVWQIRRAINIVLALMEVKKSGRKSIKISDIAFAMEDKEQLGELFDFMEDLRWDLKDCSKRAVVTIEDGYEV